MSIYSIGVSALNAAQVGLSTTGHNISNANTIGYHKQESVQITNIPNYTGGGFIGSGVQVDTVRRSYSEFLDSQVLQSQSVQGQYDAYNAQITQIDNLVADATSGVSPALQSFFSDVNSVVAAPADVPSRQAMLNGAEALVSRFNSLAGRVDEMRDGINSQVTDSVNLINSYATQIADLNSKIAIVTSASNSNQLPNDLLDQRDQLVSDLNKEIKATVVKQLDGGYNVFIGSGQPMVMGTQSMTLVAARSMNDPSRVEVGLAAGNSSVPIDSRLLQGGRLNGLLMYRSETLDMAQNALGRVAMVLAQTFNDQHKLGQDINGDMGSNFFTVPTPKVIPMQSNPVGLDAVVTVNDVGKLTTADYNLKYDGTNWVLNKVSTGAVVAMTGSGTAADPFIADGLSMVVTGAPVAGNGFQIQPTRNGARDIAVAIRDPGMVAAASPIRTAATLSTNTGTGKISAGTVNSFNDKVTITFDGTGSAYDVVDSTTGATLAKNITYVSGDNVSFNGWTVQIAGVPGAADVFTVDNTVTSTASGTATISLATLAAPSPVDPFLTNSVRAVFDTTTSYHLEGATNNVTGASTITGGVFAPALAAGANPGIVVTAGTAAIGTSGAGSYAATGTKTTITGGTIAGGPAPYTITGATLTVEGGTFAGATTFSGLTITVDGAGTISIPALGAAGTASTFHGSPATGLNYVPSTTNILSVNGWTVKLTGSPAAGDKFTVGANTSGESDSRNALLLSGLQTKNTLEGGTTTYQGAYSRLVSQIGSKAQEIDVIGKAQANLVTQAQTAQQSVSGVNLDEEAANLMRYQQAYQAAGKMIQVASAMFTALIGSLG